MQFLASRDEYPRSLCNSPGVGVRLCVPVGIGSVDKNFNLGHNFQTIKDRTFIFSYVYSLLQDLSHCTIMFDLDLEV